jgi:hypothetical protein
MASTVYKARLALRAAKVHRKRGGRLLMRLETIYKGYFVLAAMDVLLAIACAANGSLYFVYFGLLGLSMWLLGMHFKRSKEKIGE